MSTDGFGVLGTYLRERFHRRVGNLAKPPPTAVFQRLDKTDELYWAHLGLDLAATVGPEVWAALGRAAVLRHVSTHNAGVVDDRFLARQPTWPQPRGARVVVGRGDAVPFLDTLGRFACAVLTRP